MEQKMKKKIEKHNSKLIQEKKKKKRLAKMVAMQVVPDRSESYSNSGEAESELDDDYFTAKNYSPKSSIQPTQLKKVASVFSTQTQSNKVAPLYSSASVKRNAVAPYVPYEAQSTNRSCHDRNEMMDMPLS